MIDLDVSKMGHQQLADLAKLLDDQVNLYHEDKLSLYRPHIFQQKFHESDAKIRVFVGGNRPKAFGTKILMADGYSKKIEEIKIGDKVLAWNGEKSYPTTVIDIPFEGEDEIVEYTTNNGNTIQCTKDHFLPFITNQKRFNSRRWERCNFADINKSSWSLKRFMHSGEITFKTNPNPSKISGLLLGLYLGDGSSSKSPSSSNHRINFACTEKWKEILFREEVQKLDPNLNILTFDSDQFRFHISAKKGQKNSFFEELKKLNLLGLHGFNKFIPHCFKTASVEERKQLLRGLIITDGCTDRYKTTIYSTSKRLLEDALFILKSLGYYGSIYHHKDPLTEKQHECFVLQWSNQFTLEMGIDIGHKVVSLSSRKASRNDLILKSVKSLGIGKVRCIQIEDPNHCFVLENNIVTCNSGKSTACVMEAIWLCLGIHPYHKRKLPVKGKLYADSFPMLMETFFTKFKEWLHPRFLSQKKPYIYNQMGHLIGINFANGSTIKFGSYDQEERKAEGSDWDFVGFDEPPTHNLYIGNLRGTVDRKGLVWFTCTPLSELWMYEKLYLPGLSGEKKHICTIQCSSYDNPHLDPEEIALYEQELTEEERSVRILGNFPRIKGVVISTYDQRASDVEPFEITSDYVVYEGHDPHSAKPNCSLWKAFDKHQNRFVCKELKFDGSIWDWGKKIAEIREDFRQRGVRIMGSVIDTSINQKDMLRKINTYQELKDSLEEAGENLFPQLVNKKDWLDGGIKKLKDLYRVTKQEVEQEIYDDANDTFEETEKQIVTTEILAPKQFVFKDCTHYKRELITYIWPKDIEKAGVKPMPKNDDLITCDRYIESLAPSYMTAAAKKLYRYADSDAYRKRR